jgi:AbrB family looped-hinge helix DNA binding protein
LIDQIDILTFPPYSTAVIATITSKGQITIPQALRQKLNLKVGDQLEFDETAPVLTARRVVDRGNWEKTLKAWQANADQALEDHPWKNVSSAEMLDELRGGPTDSIFPRP